MEDVPTLTEEEMDILILNLVASKLKINFRLINLIWVLNYLLVNVVRDFKYGMNKITQFEHLVLLKKLSI